jgi:hypothetical protein
MRSLHQRGRDKEFFLSQFISSLFEEVRQLLPENFACLLMCRPRLLAAGDSCCQKVLQRFSGSIQGAENTRSRKCHFLRQLLLLYINPAVMVTKYIAHIRSRKCHFLRRLLIL